MGDLLKPAILFARCKMEWQQAPIVVKRFIKRALLLLVFWNLVYLNFIKPDRRIDDSLTFITTKATVKCLNDWYCTGFSQKPYYSVGSGYFGEEICIQGKQVLIILQPCNALSLFALYVSFLICVPGKKLKMVLYLINGILIIFCLNVIRLYALAWLNMNRPQWTYFAHHYAFTTIVYSVIFGLWVMYLNIRPTNEE